MAIQTQKKLMSSVLILSFLAAGCGGTKTTQSQTSKTSTTPSSSSASSGSSSSASSHSSTPASHSNKPIVVDVFAPFSGAAAAYGKFGNLPGVKAAVAEVNAQGGVMGRPIKIITTDDIGDPADAVPIAHQLVATHPNVAAIYGNPGSAAFATSKIFNQAKIVSFSVAGLTQLNAIYMRYFYRTYPPDTAESTAMAASAIKQGFKKAAIVFNTGTDAESNIPPLISAYKKAGGKILIQQRLQAGLSSYRSDVTKVIAKHPQVIFTETDPQSGATFWSEYKQLAGKLPPAIGTSTEPIWDSTVAKATGTSVAGLGSWFQTVTPKPSNQQSYNTFMKWFKKEYPKKKKPFNAYNAAIYDGVILTALAMSQTHSTNSKVYNAAIVNLTNDPNGVHVHGYAAGVSAIKQGKKIYYVGASGQETFNHYHWVSGNWQAVYPGANGLVSKFTINEAQLAKYSGSK